MGTMILGEQIWFYVTGLVFCVFTQFTIIVLLLAQRRRYKQEKRALRASETMYRLLTENASDIISRHAVDGRFLYVSPACLHVLGYRLDEMTCQSPESFVHPDDFQIISDVIKRAEAAGKDNYSVQHRIRRADGRWIWVETRGRLLRDGNGELTEIHSLVRDISDRRQIETALRTSEEKFSTLFRLVPVMSAVSLLEDGRFLEVNDAFIQGLGYTREELIGKTSTDNNLWTNPAKRQQLLDTIQQDGAVKKRELELRTKSGAIIVVFFSAEVIEIGQQSCLISAFIDITDRKQIENALRESEEKYRLLFENMAPGVMYLRDDGMVEEANPSAFEIFGAPPKPSGDQPFPLPPTKVIHEDGSDFPVAEMPAMLALKTGKAVRNVITGLYAPRKDGYVWISNTAIPQFKPGETRPYRVFVTFHDITELVCIEQELRRHQEHLEELVEERTSALQHEIAVRKQTEQSLRESEGKYRLIAENATDIIVTQNNARQFTYLSPSVKQLLGYTPEEIIQGVHGPLLTPESQELVTNVIARKRDDDPEPTRLEVEQIRKDGSTVWTDVIVKRLYDEMGHHSGFLGITREISDRKEAEAALKQAKELAEAANRAKSMFLSHMSHELRTPLNAILGFAQLLARETTLSPVQRKYADTIDRSGAHLLKLINDILSLAKIESGHMAVNSTNFDLWQILATVENMIRMRAEQKELQFSVESMPDVPRYINADENKLRQVLINLLGNAVKFTEKGAVTLKIARLDSEMTAAKEPSHSQIAHLTFEISDTGPGINSEDLPTIFDVFHQSSHPQNIEGAGLGLTISRKFVQLLGGDLRVHSQVGQGSVFSFTIPVEVVEHEGLPFLPSLQNVIGLAPEQSAVRILVAEDHTENRQFFVTLLSSVGFDVRAVTNGREAIDQSKEWFPHLILMDIRMPVMDGYETTRKIRELERLRQVPIIAVTASVFEDEQQRILSAGCNALLCKPLNSTEVLEAIRTHLDVQYVYKEDASTPLEGKASIARSDHLSPDALAKLPQELLSRLAQAALQINIAATEQAIAAIREQNQSIADALSVMAKDLRYREIWTLISPQIKKEGG